jgi:hypothetical protein
MSRIERVESLVPAPLEASGPEYVDEKKFDTESGSDGVVVTEVKLAEEA